MFIYAVYDKVAMKYGKPFFCENDKLAIREFNIGIASLHALIKKDYILSRIGVFVEETGHIDKTDIVVLVGSLDPVVDDSDDEGEKIENE